MTTSNSKRLAKNAIYIYIRMFFLMLISFYTSRVVLKQLGIEDFGIYNLVGSIVAMFNSLKAVFASSTQRYLNYEMGAGNYGKLNIVFNMSLYINFTVAFLFVILVEIAGICFFNTGINIAPDRVNAAFVVFQFSMLTAVISIISSVFDAEVISHEKMSFYAFLYMFESCLKLGIVFLLTISPYDKLVSYGLLYLIITSVSLAINYIYCRINFSEVRIKMGIDYEYLKKMTSFAGWNFFGNTAYALTQSGMNIILNIFGGPVVNAARGLAFQVNSAMLMFLSNIGIVVNPFSIKLYAKNEFLKFYEMIFLSSKLFFAVQLCLVFPILCCTDKLLGIWLTDVPKYTVPFLQLILIHSLIRSLHSPIDTIYKASGNIKYYQIVEGVLLSLPLLFSYLALKIGFDYYVLFVIVIVAELLNMIAIICILKKQVGFDVASYLQKVICPCIGLALIPLFFFIICNQFIFFNWIFKFVCSIIIDLLICCSLILFVLNKKERHSVLSLV